MTDLLTSQVAVAAEVTLEEVEAMVSCFILLILHHSLMS